MSENTGCQAFPKQKWEYDGQNNVLQYQEEGMTLREYFAAKAMAAYISTAGAPCIIGGLDGAEEELAKQAYKMADAMLRARGQ